MELINELKTFSDSKQLPKEYLIFKLRIFFNKELYEKGIISFDIYHKMQQFLMKKMDKLMLENKF